MQRRKINRKKGGLLKSSSFFIVERSKMEIRKAVFSAARALNRSLPDILTVGAVIGTAATVFFTGKAAIKADRLISETGEKDRTKELIKICWPAAISAAATLACIIGANRICRRRTAALKTAYRALEANYGDLKMAALGAAGAKAEAAGKRMAGEHDAQREDKEKTFIFYDRYSRRSIEASCEDVVTAEYMVNRLFALRGYATLNDFYEFLKMPKWEAGDQLGWSFDDGLNWGYEWIDFTNLRHEDEDGRIWYSIEMLFEPTIEGAYY